MAGPAFFVFSAGDRLERALQSFAGAFTLTGWEWTFALIGSALFLLWLKKAFALWQALIYPRYLRDFRGADDRLIRL